MPREIEEKNRIEGIWILINHIPTTFFSILRYMAFIDILKYSLMKISNIIVI